MKILLIGDPHFQKSNLHVMHTVCQEILQVIDQTQPDLVVNLGDTEDRHENLYQPAHTMAVQFFKAIALRCPLVVLIGNHDRTSNNVFLEDSNPFIGMEHYPNITIVHTTLWDHERNLLFVPFVPKGRFHEALSKVDYYPTREDKNIQHPSLIFSHQDYNGAAMSNGKLMTDGDSWSNDLPHIFNGHVHKYQEISNIGVTCVGTFMQQNYGEDTDKALMLVNLKEDNTYTTERIRLKSVPLKVTVDIDIKDLANFASYIPPNCLVKVRLHLDATDTKAVKQNPNYLAMKSLVDVIEEKVESNSASIAEKMVTGYKDQGILKKEKKIFSIEEIVTAMLHDDEFTLEVFNRKINI